jgi:hypothetical protein
MRRSIQRLILDLLGRLGLPTAIRRLAGEENEIASQIITPLHFTKPGDRGFLERHITQIVRALRAGNRQVSASNVIAHLCPEALLELSYDLDRDAGVALRSYLADLPDGIAPLFTKTADTLLASLSTRAQTGLVGLFTRPQA